MFNNCPPPKIPPKPNHLRLEEMQPLYTTTVPPTHSPPLPPRESQIGNCQQSPQTLQSQSKQIGNTITKFIRQNSADQPKLKGILKHTSPQPIRMRSSLHELDRRTFNDADDETRQFELAVNDNGSLPVMARPNRSSQSNVNLSNLKSHDARSSSTTQKQKQTREEQPNSEELNDEMNQQASASGRLESLSGVVHVFVIVASVVTVVAMTRLTTAWEVQLRRCPLYVATGSHRGVYWGNPRLFACHYTAYTPTLLMLFSLSLLILHAGVLYSWRHAKNTGLLLSQMYPKMIFVVTLIELFVAISVAGVLLDGLRQTCVSFQLNPWIDERPPSCIAGYRNRDDVYGLSHTYEKIVCSAVASAISVIVLMIICSLYAIRMRTCGKR